MGGNETHNKTIPVDPGISVFLSTSNLSSLRDSHRSMEGRFSAFGNSNQKGESMKSR